MSAVFYTPNTIRINRCMNDTKRLKHVVYYSHPSAMCEMPFSVEEIPTEQTQIRLSVNVFFLPNLSDIRRFTKSYLKLLSVTTSKMLMHRDNTTPTHKNAIWRPIPTTQNHAIDHNRPSVWYVLKGMFGPVRHLWYKTQYGMESRSHIVSEWRRKSIDSVKSEINIRKQIITYRFLSVFQNFREQYNLFTIFPFKVNRFKSTASENVNSFRLISLRAFTLECLNYTVLGCVYKPVRRQNT